jgi:hypothetical protein
MARAPFCSQVLFPVACFLCHPEFFLCHPERSCVIPSEAEGPRIFLDARRRTLNHGSTAVSDARASFRHLCHSRCFVSFTAKRRIPDPSLPHRRGNASPTRVSARLERDLFPGFPTISLLRRSFNRRPEPDRAGKGDIRLHSVRADCHRRLEISTGAQLARGEFDQLRVRAAYSV